MCTIKHGMPCQVYIQILYFYHFSVFMNFSVVAIRLKPSLSPSTFRYSFCMGQQFQFNILLLEYCVYFFDFPFYSFHSFIHSFFLFCLTLELRIETIKFIVIISNQSKIECNIRSNFVFTQCFSQMRTKALLLNHREKKRDAIKIFMIDTIYIFVRFSAVCSCLLIMTAEDILSLFSSGFARLIVTLWTKSLFMIRIHQAMVTASWQ